MKTSIITFAPFTRLDHLQSRSINYIHTHLVLCGELVRSYFVIFRIVEHMGWDDGDVFAELGNSYIMAGLGPRPDLEHADGWPGPR